MKPYFEREKEIVIGTIEEMTFRDIAQLQRYGYDVKMEGDIIVGVRVWQ